MIFDDGSSIDYSTGASTDAPAGMLLGDVYDYSHMAAPQAAYTGQSGWDSIGAMAAQMVGYGFTKAIDNRFGPTNVAGNTNPGSFAGQNGKTYVNAKGQVVQAGGFDPMMLLLLAGAGLVVYLAARG